MKNILIIGCGLLGSSLLRRISKKKIAKKIFIYEKSKLNIAKIKRLKLPGTIVKSLKEGVNNFKHYILIVISRILESGMFSRLLLAAALLGLANCLTCKYCVR